MEICKFKRASINEIIYGNWTPFNPTYHPFAELDEFCIPCYRWRFLELIRGHRPIWQNLIRNPANGEEFQRFFYIERFYRKFVLILLRMLSRSVFPNSIINLLNQPLQLLDQLRGNSQPEDYHLISIEYVSRFLRRLNDENKLQDYLSNDSIFFNVQILNENFNLHRTITLQTRPRMRIVVPQRQHTQPLTFQWRGPIAFVGEIPILDLKNRVIKSILFIADDFFDPPLDLSLPEDLPPLINQLFIDKEFHKLWILRECLIQLSNDQVLSPNIQDAAGNILFTPSQDLMGIPFENFNLILETCLLYTSPSPRDLSTSRMPSSA